MKTFDSAKFSGPSRKGNPIGGVLPLLARAKEHFDGKYGENWVMDRFTYCQLEPRERSGIEIVVTVLITPSEPMLEETE